MLLRAPWAEGRVLQLQHPLLPNPSSSCIRPWHAVCWGASALPGGLAGAARHMLCPPTPPQKSQNLEGYYCVQVLIQPSLALLHLIPLVLPLLDPGVHAPLTCMSAMPMVGSGFFFLGVSNHPYPRGWQGVLPAPSDALASLGQQGLQGLLPCPLNTGRGWARS